MKPLEVQVAVAQGPTVPRRRLRSELRVARDAANLTQEQVADQLDWSTSKIIRIEAGTVGVSTTDLRALLALYGVQDEHHVSELVDLAKLSRKRSWWTAIKDDEISSQQRMLIGFETETTMLHYFHPLLIPGLLQTEAYAAALLRDCAIPPPTPMSFQTRLQVRLTRQRETLQRDNPPRLHAIIDEGVLHRPVGDVVTTKDQLAHLLELGRRPNITIEVLPLSAGAHPGIVYGAFEILQFENSADSDVVYVAGDVDMILSDQPEKIAKYWNIMRRLQEKTLPAPDSALLIERLLEEHR